MVIKQIADMWIKEKSNFVKESTISAYSLLLINHVVPWFGKKKIFTSHDLQTFVLEEIKSGLKQKSVKDIVVVIKMIQKYGVKNGLMRYELLEVNYPVNHENTEMEVLSKANETKLINYLFDNISFKNLGILICLLTGIRIGEVCALKWSDIDFKNKVIKIRRTIQRIYIIEEDKRFTRVIESIPKTKQSNRDIPIVMILYSLLKDNCSNKKENYILTNTYKPLEPRSYRTYYNNLLNKLNIPKLKFHGLRHSFATRCIESKCDYKTISSLLGHSNITTTLNLYVHPDNRQKRKCIENMVRYIRQH